MPSKGHKPKAWHERKLRRGLKRSQLRRARKEAEKQRKRGGRVSDEMPGEAKGEDEAGS